MGNIVDAVLYGNEAAPQTDAEMTKKWEELPLETLDGESKRIADIVKNAKLVIIVNVA